MGNLENNSNDSDDWTALDLSFDTSINQRIAVRYVRKDIAASVLELNSFSNNFLFKKNKEILAELIGISSKGVLIATNKKLKVNNKITLILKFEDSKIFKINAKVVRKSQVEENHYGLTFDHISNDLGDYLLKTQHKLEFK